MASNKCPRGGIRGTTMALAELVVLKKGEIINDFALFRIDPLETNDYGFLIVTKGVFCFCIRTSLFI